MRVIPLTGRIIDRHLADNARADIAELQEIAAKQARIAEDTASYIQANTEALERLEHALERAK